MAEASDERGLILKLQFAGDYDYILKVMATDMNDFDRVYQRLIAKVELEAVTSLITMEAIADGRDLPL